MSNKLETKFSNKHFDAIEKGAAEKNGTYFKIIVDYFEKLLPNKKILCVDIGCGSGVHFSGLASNLNTYLIGVDAPNDYTELLNNDLFNVASIQVYGSVFPALKTCSPTSFVFSTNCCCSPIYLKNKEKVVSHFGTV